MYIISVSVDLLKFMVSLVTDYVGLINTPVPP